MWDDLVVGIMGCYPFQWVSNLMRIFLASCNKAKRVKSLIICKRFVDMHDNG